MIRGIILSFFLHLFLWLLFFFILPRFFITENNIIDISVDIVTYEEIYPVVLPEKIIKDKNTIIQPEIEDKLTETKKIAEPEIKKEPEIEKPIEPEESIVEQNEEKSGLNLDDILADIKQAQNRERNRLAEDRDKYGNNLTSYEKNRVRRQVNNCWSNIVNKLFSKEELAGVKVKMLVSLDEEGNILKVKEINTLTLYENR